MAGEAPGRGGIQTGGGEGGKAQLVLVGGDVLGNSLQAGEVLDLVERVACLFQQLGIDDDAEGLIAVACAVGLAVLTLEVEVGRGHLVQELRAVKREAVVLPGVQSRLIAALEQRRGVLLGHFGGQRGLIGAAGGGDDLDGNAGLFGVGLGKCLPCTVCFRLEVQEIDRAFVAALAAGEQADGEDQHEGQSDDLFHDVASQLIFR